ncbi:hypothetical protein SANA_20210 [Gottschalkiaceae bacterium SANA]|nr:hypothetical protein SANA_20210 [Gottschalkiaceae bacterium SANA]
MIRISKGTDLLILDYYSDNQMAWVAHRLKEEDEVILRRCFHLTLKNIILEDEDEDEDVYTQISELDSLEFIIGEMENDYYVIEPEILGISQRVKIHKNCRINTKCFIAYRDISIFRKISEVIASDIIIGPNKDEIPGEVFNQLIKNFPNSTELTKYARLRIEHILEEFVDASSDYIAQYNDYMNRKVSARNHPFELDYLNKYELHKYEEILFYLKHMLSNESKYLEADWQKQIMKIVLLLYPKYLYAFDNVTIKDVDTGTTKYLDFMLIDFNGHIDIIEIKRPSDYGVISVKQYRNNHIPLKQLSGSVMQLEKYIYYLNRWSVAGEKKLTATYSKNLPDGFKIKIVNPKGLIVLGMDENFTDKQRTDMEIIKRKYKSVIDIVTYDDLIRRLESIIERFRKA